MTNEKYNKVVTCRVCDSKDIGRVINFGNVSYSTCNNQLHNDNSKFTEFSAPLTFLRCPDCLNFQLGEVVNPSLLYDSFSYKSDTTLGLDDYFSGLAIRMQKRFDIPKKQKRLILEIGSNTGRFISLFKPENWKVVGVEPSSKLAEETSRLGIKTYNKFFSQDLAGQILQEEGVPDVIYVANTLANIHDLNEVFGAFVKLMNDDTTLIIDTQDVNSVIKGYLIDTIYHEHLNYFSISSLKYLCEKFSLFINQVEYHPSKGGCFTVYISRIEELNKKESIKKIIKSEEKTLSENKVMEFATSIFNVKEMIADNLKGNIQSSCCFGSSVGCSMLANFLELDRYCEFIYDDNPNCNSILGPTRNLKVFHSKELFINSNLENIIILAHRYAANISLKWPDSFREKINVLYPVPK